MKNNQLLAMYRMYFTIIIVAGLLILIISNIYVLNKFDQEKNKNITEIMQNMSVRKDYIEKGMVLMFNNVYLQRNFIEDSLSNLSSAVPLDNFNKRFQYDSDLKISSLDEYQKKTSSELGNIIINGDIKDVDKMDMKEIAGIQEVFKFQEYLNRNSPFDVWSVYYSKNGYITIYPFSYSKEIINNKDEVFEAVNSSIDQLNQINDDETYQNGCDTNIFWDNTNSEIMFSKNMIVVKDGIIEGVVSSNISIEDVRNNIGDQGDDELFIIDSLGDIVFNNKDTVSKIETIYNYLENRYNVEDIQKGIESNGFYKIGGDYLISQNLNNVQWKIMDVVPGNKVERPLYERILIIILICTAIILAVILFLRLIKKYYEEYSRIDELKSEFLMMISHDLKTPLSNILGFIELIQNKFNNTVVPKIGDQSQEVTKTVDRIQRNLKIIEKEADRLSDMVDDLLDLSKLESGEAVLNKTSINIPELFQEVYGITQSLVNSKHLKYTIEIEPYLPEVKADRQKLMQVQVNLISNAVKFTDVGSISCYVKKQEHNLVFSVKDTGVGIPKEIHDKIFNKFERGKFQADTKIPGSGVGLAICKSIIELHNGQIWVESEVNVGSTFTFSIPFHDIREEFRCV